MRAPLIACVVLVGACSKDPPMREPAAGAAALGGSRCIREMGAARTPAAAVAPERCPVDPDGAPPVLPRKQIRIRETAQTLAVEVASSPETSERGLMFRKQRLEENQGMLFELPKRVQTFWMHNTCIPLDMIFADEDGFVQGVLEEVPPMNDEPRAVGCSGRYVLEVDAGWSRRHGLKPGMHLDIMPPASVLSPGKP